MHLLPNRLIEFRKTFIESLSFACLCTFAPPIFYMIRMLCGASHGMTWTKLNVSKGGIQVVSVTPPTSRDIIS